MTATAAASTEQPAARFAALRARADLNALIRRFFAERGVLEVETPVLSAAGNSDPHIQSFTTQFHGHRDAGPARRWLRTSPEYPLKRLLAAGLGDCYELGRVFRDGEAGARHNPEFSLLEWYRLGFDHRRLMGEVAELVSAAMASVGKPLSVARISYRDWFWQAFALDPHQASSDRIAALLDDIRIEPSGLGRDDWLDLVVSHRLQPANPTDRLLLVHDYPASQCALARIRPGTPALAERFEAFLGPLELANGYHELNDADEQAARFARDLQGRQQRGLDAVAIDQRLLAALPALPDCAGVALGVDRLLAAITGEPDIRRLLAFDFAQA
ncbi:MAG: EF-P lysine aminoacylase EpmA [Lysobacterales bacterium]